MSTPLKHQPFMALNASRVEKIRDGVVKRPAPGVPLSSDKIRRLFEEKKSTQEIAKSEPDRALVDVGQPQPQPESEPESVPAKRTGPNKGHKRSPEAIAKQKETLARKKRSKARASNKARGGKGEKAAFVRAHPGIPAPEVVKLAAKQGLKFTTSHVYNVRKIDSGNAQKRAPKTQLAGNGPSSNDASITDLLQAIIEATSEIARRLSQLTL